MMDTLAAPRWGESTLKNSDGKGGRDPPVGTTKCPVSVVEKRSDTLAAQNYDPIARSLTRGNHELAFARPLTGVRLNSVLSCVMFALTSGDLYIEGSNEYNDYRKQLVSWEGHESEIELYCEQVGLSRNPGSFVGSLRSELEETIKSVDESFPTNEDISIKKGEFVLRRVTRQPEREASCCRRCCRRSWDFIQSIPKPWFAGA